MEASREIDVTSLDAAHRQAFEDVIGTRLQRSQRLIISVAEITATAGVARSAQSIDDWKKVYDGLSDEEVALIDRDVTTRANLTRNLP
jgi:hypothetical protein